MLLFVCRPAGASARYDSETSVSRNLSPTTIARRLSVAVGALDFSEPVTHVYNPLDYAWVPHRAYLQRYAKAPKEAVFLGMNPGPFGMAQTGVPFGDVAMVRDWLGLKGRVGRPEQEHHKRQVLGFECPRSEVSGTRVWSWARDRFGSPDCFFERFFVWNYCPLSFMEASGRNRTPDKLHRQERAALFDLCDEALGLLIDTLQPKYVIGIGRFATERIKKNSAIGPEVIVGMAPHPSPASPAANRGWAPIFESALLELGLQL